MGAAAGFGMFVDNPLSDEKVRGGRKGHVCADVPFSFARISRLARLLTRQHLLGFSVLTDLQLMICICTYNHMGGGGPSDCQSTGVCRSTRKGQMSMHRKRRTGSVSLLTGRP